MRPLGWLSGRALARRSVAPHAEYAALLGRSLPLRFPAVLAVFGLRARWRAAPQAFRLGDPPALALLKLSERFAQFRPGYALHHTGAAAGCFRARSLRRPGTQRSWVAAEAKRASG